MRASAPVAAPAWQVHLPTADRTCVRLRLPPPGPRDPWPLSLLLASVAHLGCRRSGPPRTLGRGHGLPLLMSQTLAWEGGAVEVEAAHPDGGPHEVIVAMPPWDELVERLPDEAALWDLVDAAAAAVGAGAGVLGEGEAALDGVGEGDWIPATLRRHLGVLAPAGAAPGWWGSRYRSLPLSGLDVLLR